MAGVSAAFAAEGQYRPIPFEEAEKLYPQTLDARDFGAAADDGKDDAEALRAAVAAAAKMTAKGGVRIVLGKGSYDILTYEKGVGVPVRNLSKIMIDGRGAAIISHKERAPFASLDSEDITFANLKFKAAELPFAGAKVVAVGNGYLDCEVVPPHVIREVSPKAIIGFDRANDAIIWTRTDFYQKKSSLLVKKLSEAVMRVPLEDYLKKRTEAMPKVGDDVVVRYRVYDPPAIILEGGRNARVYNADILTHAGMGIHGRNTENILICNLRVSPQTKDLWMSSTADATHFNTCRGCIDILDSVFEKMGDDAVNVHQMYWIVSEKISPKVLKVIYGKTVDGHYLPVEILPRIGETVAFGEPNNPMNLSASAKVAKVEPDTKNKTALIALESDAPAWVAAGTPVANLSADPKLTIKNCKVRGNRARGFLVKVSEASIEDCEFERTTGAGILLENDVNFWYEGIRVNNLTVKNCKFKACDAPGIRGDKIEVISDSAKDSKGKPLTDFVNKTVTVENCSFEQCGENPISLPYTANPILKNNSIKN